MNKKDLKVLIADGSNSSEYIEFLNKRYNVEVVNNSVIPDLVLFTGGEDVNPARYMEGVGRYTQYNTRRDEKEINIYYNYQGIVPMLGVCRGSQLLTVLKGGKLIQHTTGHGQSHEVESDYFSDFIVTSTHHQMLWPFDLNKKDYNIIAYSKYFRSNTYLDGNNNEKNLPKDFVEPEIVSYGNSVLCIQGHPEYSNATEEFQNNTFALIEKLLDKSLDKLNHKLYYAIAEDQGMAEYDEDYYENEDENDDLPY